MTDQYQLQNLRISPRDFPKCVQHDAQVACVCNTRILDTYVYSTVRVYIYFFLYVIFFVCMYIMCMYVCNVCVCACVCMYYGSAEDIRTRFLKLLRFRRMWENETYISDSRGNDLICCHSSNVMSIFVFSKTFPAICFPINSATHRAQVYNKNSTCCHQFCYRRM